MKGLLHYFLLVGLPIAGLLVVLHLGQGLTPPRAVWGTWAPAFEGAGACPEPLPELLVISQSGRRLTLNVHTEGRRRPLEGRIVRDSLEADYTAGDCPGEALRAVAGGRRPQDRLRGALALTACGCRPAAFEAVRKPERGR